MTVLKLAGEHRDDLCRMMFPLEPQSFTKLVISEPLAFLLQFCYLHRGQHMTGAATNTPSLPLSKEEKTAKGSTGSILPSTPLHTQSSTLRHHWGFGALQFIQLYNLPICFLDLSQHTLVMTIITHHKIRVTSCSYFNIIKYTDTFIIKCICVIP